MPGQHKRKRRQEADRRSRELPPGRWEPLLTTEGQAEFRAYVRRLYAEGRMADPEHLRMDTFSRRLERPTVYRVSLFMPEPSA
ncbi:hypothetical protein ACGFYU_22210 [Streptomyces sp. NPDC048337]|uniref:hypothetical protein n=1 Tax=Streptomyces sp. NPDC048337 TaxID=3365535 RepID=UPI0037108C6A